MNADGRRWGVAGQDERDGRDGERRREGEAERGGDGERGRRGIDLARLGLRRRFCEAAWVEMAETGDFPDCQSSAMVGAPIRDREYGGSGMISPVVTISNPSL